jgi:hypothetical protein
MLSLLMMMIPKIFPSIKTQALMINTTPRCGTKRSINRLLPSRLILNNKKTKKKPKWKSMRPPRRKSVNSNLQKKSRPRERKMKRRLSRNSNWLRRRKPVNTLPKIKTSI